MYIGRTVNKIRTRIQYITLEPLQGDVDGVNKVFSTTYSFLPDTLEIYLNGLRLLEGGDFIKEASDTVRIETPLFVEDILETSYVRNSI